jgi:hypothetical protein
VHQRGHAVVARRARGETGRRARERDAQCAEALRQANAPGTPVLVVRGKPQLGFDPRRVLEALG